MQGKKERNSCGETPKLTQNALHLEGRKTEREMNGLMDGG